MDGNFIDSLPQGNEWPQFTAADVTDNEAKVLLLVNHEVVWFEGHFPDHPVLPGVVQVHWAACLGKMVFTELSGFSSIANLKFNNTILPDSQVTLTLRYIIEKKSVKFTYHCGDVICSSGVLEFTAE